MNLLSCDHCVAMQNDWGQSNVPARLSAPGAGVAAVHATWCSSAALMLDGTVVTWGSNEYGMQSPPVGLANVVQLELGATFTLALLSDGAHMSRWAGRVPGC